MKRFILVAGATLLLAACGSIPGVTPAQSALLNAERDFTVAEQGFDTAVKLSDAAIDTGALPAATVQKIKALADSGYADVKLGRAAVTAANPTSIEAEAVALTSLVTQITALIPAT